MGVCTYGIGSMGGHRKRAIKTERFCKAEGCRTKLNMYNRGSFCMMHRNPARRFFDRKGEMDLKKIPEKRCD